MPLISIPGLSTSTKLPGFYGETKLAAGRISAASIPRRLLLVGRKTSGGAMTADSTPVRVLSEDEADTQAGAGSPLAQMAYGAFRVPGIEVWLGAQSDGGSPAAATATITIAGSWTTTGTLIYRVSGRAVSVTVGASMTVTNVAAAIVAAINADTKMPVTAANSSGVVTLTTNGTSVLETWHALFEDTTNAPSGLTSTLAGGTSMSGGGVRFTGGAGSQSPATLITACAAMRFDRIAVEGGNATLDATNWALWEAAVDAKAQVDAAIGFVDVALAANPGDGDLAEIKSILQAL